MIAFNISALWSWIQFMAYTVLPIAFMELLHWLHDWQILVTGVLVLIAARIWGRSVVRAARISAKAARQQGPAEPPKKTSPAPKVVPIPVAAGGELRAKRPLPVPASELADRLFALREQIRGILGRMPSTDEMMSAERLAECRRIAEFPLGDPPANAPKLLAHRFDVLRSELSALGAVRETDSCRNAWEALARISMDARDMLVAEMPPAAAATK